jgi:hypothetical protein
VVGFELEESGAGEPERPSILALKPGSVEQGRTKPLTLTVRGDNFSEGARLLVNNLPVEATVSRGGKAMTARLPASLFAQAVDLLIQARNPESVASDPLPLRVLRPADPVIRRLTPNEAPGPANRVLLRIIGENFRPTSKIKIQRIEADGSRGETARFDPESIKPARLTGTVPATFARRVGAIAVRIEDDAVEGVVSNEERFAIFGPRIHELQTSVGSVTAGAGGFQVRIAGSNFREGAEVRLNSNAVPASRVARISDRLIKVTIQSRQIQNSGALVLTVRNPDGNESEAKEIAVNAPKIARVEPGALLAGTDKARIDIHGSFFRRHSSVRLTTPEGVEIKRRVRFHSREHITVLLSGAAGRVLDQPAMLSLRVVNPNNDLGVASESVDLEVAGPRIEAAAFEPVDKNEKIARLVIQGKHFRSGSLIRFFAGELLYREEAPDQISAEKLVLAVKRKKLEAYAGLHVAVLNPGAITSNRVRASNRVLPAE